MKARNIFLCGLLGLSIVAPSEVCAAPMYAAAPAPKSKARDIKKVEPVSVESPVGTVPRLPYQLLVTYSDKRQEWRQVKWMNSMQNVEQQQANPDLYPAGKEYTIQGYIIGDNTTDNGYPVTASVKVVAGEYQTPANQLKAQPIPLSEVQLTGDNRLTNNRDMLIEHLIALDVTQQLYNYRDTYGLPTEGYTVSDGWDSPTTKLKGHGTGHYMSALAFAFASAQKAEQKQQLYLRIERMVQEMRQCQEHTFVYDEALGRYREARDYAPEEELRQMKGTWAAMNEQKKDYAKYGYGYMNAIPASHCVLIEKYAPYNNEQGVWAPYYTVHKQLAGLIDIANTMRASQGQFAVPQGHLSLTEVADKAQLIAKDMGLWVWNRMHYRTYIKRDGDKAERQARPGNRYEMWNMYIAGEVGGMCEALSRLSEMVSDPTEKAHLLEAANCFDTPALFDPVSKNIDDIRTRHANQHIPMFVGALRSYLGNNNPYYYNLALNFWNMIQGRYAYATGGVGNGEMWRQPYTQILSMNTSVQSDHQRNMFPNPDINETCCVYNLLKLTKDLNCFDPDNAAYMDYYERALYNQLIGSVNAHRYGVCYQYAVGMNAIKPFGSETPQSTCCGGTGSENHVKYQEAAYFANDNTLWVALYMPSKASWKAQGITLEQQCQWPAEKSTIRIASGEGKSFSLRLRVPYWATEGFDIRLNGKSLAKKYAPSSYFEVGPRQWSKDDVLEVIMPFTKHINWGPDKMDLAATGKNQSNTPFDPQWVGAIMYGPLVMATPDVKEWKDAEFKLSGNLSEIQLGGVKGEDGTHGPLYTLSLTPQDKGAAPIQFQPDYYQTKHETHYLRLQVESTAKKSGKGGLEKEQLEQLIQLAKERQQAQEAWDALTVKVPAFSPWAPYGYKRLLAEMEAARQVLSKPSKQLTQEELNKVASSLNVAINTMRPGNLAEPEDLSELLPLVTEAKKVANKSTELREAINYADMVISYVNDGSGTHDLIEKALTRLKAATK